MTDLYEAVLAMHVGDCLQWEVEDVVRARGYVYQRLHREGYGRSRRYSLLVDPPAKQRAPGEPGTLFIVRLPDP